MSKPTTGFSVVRRIANKRRVGFRAVRVSSRIPVVDAAHRISRPMLISYLHERNQFFLLLFGGEIVPQGEIGFWDVGGGV